MDTIPHRELRNNSSEVLARVANGETIAITNHGKLAAIIGPPNLSALDQARQSGEVREPKNKSPRFNEIARVRLDVTTEEVLADLRGDR